MLCPSPNDMHFVYECCDSLPNNRKNVSFVIFINKFLLRLFSSTNPQSLMLKCCWGFFSASISNVYVFEFLGLKYLHFLLLKQIFYAQGEWKMVPLNKWSHLFQSKLNKVFSPAKVGQVLETCKLRPLNKSSSYSESH